ncbi:MAG: hypothetical protein JJ932_12195 [Balneolaceae bacterium]|nr:hypothetical protein [Balneolaceae bacterium]
MDYIQQNADKIIYYTGYLFGLGVINLILWNIITITRGLGLTKEELEEYKLKLKQGKQERWLRNLKKSVFLLIGSGLIIYFFGLIIR